MNYKEVENKNKLYLWVSTSLGRCFEFISRICFDLDNLKDTPVPAHNGSMSVQCCEMLVVLYFWSGMFIDPYTTTNTNCKDTKPKIYTILPKLPH